MTQLPLEESEMSYQKVEQSSDSEDSIDQTVSKDRKDRKELHSVFRGPDGEPLIHPEPKDVFGSNIQSSSKELRTLHLPHKVSAPELKPNKDAEKQKKAHRRESSVHSTGRDSFDIVTLAEENEHSRDKRLADLSAQKSREKNVESIKQEKPKVTFEDSTITKFKNFGKDKFNGLHRRTHRRKGSENLTVDTQLSNFLNPNPPTSARSTGIESSTSERFGQIDKLSDIVDSNSNTLQSGNQNNKGKNTLSIAFQELRYNIFKASNPRTKARTSTQQSMSDLDAIDAYLHLAEKIKIRSIYFDPELDILNRFCLEFSAIAVKTLPTGVFSLKPGNAVKRVFTFMDKRVNSISTPTDDQPLSPDIPVLLTHLFLNEFRIRSDGTNAIGINVPLFSHSNRLSLDRFDAITRSIFDRRDYFYRNVDISRHNLADLE